MHPGDGRVLRRKMNYPPLRKSQHATPGRPLVEFLQRKRQHRYSYLLDGDEDLDTGKEPVGFFAITRPRLNRKHRDLLEGHEGQKSFTFKDDETVATSASNSPEKEKVSWTTRDLGHLFKHLHSSQLHLDGSFRSTNINGYIPTSLQCQKDDLKPTKPEPTDNDYAATEIESSEDDSSVESRTQTRLPSRKRLVRFADEVGRPLIETTLFEDDDEERTRRLIVLLLSPNNRKFEFVHASYRILERMTLSDIIQQLPDLATNEILANQRYTGLCRVRFGFQELINQVAVQSCALGQDEVLIAIAEGYRGKDLATLALPIFSNREIVRAVKAAKRSGRAVKVLQSGVSTDQRKASQAKKLEEKHPRHMEMPPDLDEVSPTPVTENPVPASMERRKEGNVDDDEPAISEGSEDVGVSVPNLSGHQSEHDMFANSSFATYLNTGAAVTALAIFLISASKSLATSH